MSNTAEEKRVKRTPIGKDISTRRREARIRRHNRLRNHLRGTAERPRLAVFRSSRHMHAQIIDDTDTRRNSVNQLRRDRTMTVIE